MLTTPLRVAVRLLPAERALVAELQDRIATAHIPDVSVADVLRAGIRALAATTTAAAGGAN